MNNTELLKSYDLRYSKTRNGVVEVFQNTKRALSHPEIETLLNQEVDRVTLYRTLHAFEEHGLVHTVLDANGGMKYAFCGASCSRKAHRDSHLHFECEKCKSTECLNQISIEVPLLPEGYSANKIHFLVTGVCSKCA